MSAAKEETQQKDTLRILSTKTSDGWIPGPWPSVSLCLENSVSFSCGSFAALTFLVFNGVSIDSEIETHKNKENTKHNTSITLWSQDHMFNFLSHADSRGYRSVYCVLFFYFGFLSYFYVVLRYASAVMHFS